MLFSCSVHVGSVRQTATITSMSKDHLRTGDKAVVRFRFIKNPEYLRPDVRLVFREGRTKAVGTVTRIVPMTVVVPGASRQLRTATASNSKRETGQGSGQGQTGQQHPQRPQNEPQKPSKRNRRGRGGAAANKQTDVAVAAGGAAKPESGVSSSAKSSAGSSNIDVTGLSDDAKRRESIPSVPES